MYGPPRDCKGKFGREDKSAQMYSAFEWRSFLLARMRCARVCPYKRRGRWRPFSVSGFRHVVVTVLSSLLPCADFGGELVRRRGTGKVGARSASTPEASFPRLGWYGGWSVIVATGRYSPGGAGDLIGHSHYDDVLVSPSVEPIKPGTDGCSISLDAQPGCPGTMDQDLAQVDVAALADTQKVRLASGGVLTRHDAKPGGELPALMESGSVADRGNDRCSHNGPDARNLSDAGAASIGCAVPFQLIVQIFELLLDQLLLTPEHVDQVAHPRSQVGFGVLKNIAHGSLQLGWRLREHQATFQKKGANLVDHSGTSRNQPVANAVNGL